MFCVIGLYATARWEVVLQTWLCKETDVRREVVLQAESRAERPLQWSMECGLVAEFYRAIDIIVCVEWCIDRYIHLHAKISIKIPSPHIIYIIGTLQWYAEVMDGLLFTDGVSICTYLGL